MDRSARWPITDKIILSLLLDFLPAWASGWVVADPAFEGLFGPEAAEVEWAVMDVATEEREVRLEAHVFRQKEVVGEGVYSQGIWSG